MKQKLLSLFFVLTCLIGVATGQSRQVSGKVTDESGVALSGVTVISQKSTVATQTDNYGNYIIQSEKGSTITFRLIGYADRALTVGDANTINVKLIESNVGLEEVVVTAYGKQNKEAIVGAVASISSKDIEKRPVSSATAVLEGLAPGVMVNNSNGQPGASPNIRIRGFGSVTGSSAPAYILDGVVFEGNISDINPADIESISVLKDATSATLYGNRGANGVIVITTKRGSSGSSDLSLVVNQGLFTRGIPEYDKLDAKQFMEAAWQGFRNQYMWAPNNKLTLEQANAEATKNLVPTVLKLNIFNLPDDKLFDGNGNLLPEATIKGTYGEDLNWFKYIERKGYRQDYNLSGRGGNEKGNYLFSVGYLNEEGYIKTSDFDRLSGRLSATITPKSWISAGLSANASHQNSNNTSEGGGFTNPWNYAREVAPIYPVYLHDAVTGNYVLDSDGQRIYDNGETSRNQNVGRHMIWENELNLDAMLRNTLNSQAFVNIKFLKNFDFKVLGDINVRNSLRKEYQNALIGDGVGNKGRGIRTIYNYKNYTFAQQLTYANTFATHHNIDLFVGHENYSNWYNYLYGFKANQNFAGKHELVNFTQITNLTDYQVERSSESYLGRARYNYDEKYFVEGSFRRDGSSQVSPDHRWDNFWSLGATWMISKENFMQNAAWVNALKLRAATGVVGNLASLGEYDFMSLYAMGQNNNQAALYKSNIENLDLRWEGNKSTSLALEGRLWNRMNFVVEYFNKTSNDLIFNVNLPLSVGSVDNLVGAARVKRNLGQLVNKGFEFTFDVDAIKTSDLRWNIGTNASFFKNKIVEMPAQYKEAGLLASPFNYKEGHSVYDFYLYQYAGVDMMTGQALYRADTEKYDPTNKAGAWSPFQQEVNGTMYTRNAAYAKREYSGSAIPKLMGSFSTALDYKDFSLSALFTYSVGGKGLDYSYVSLMGLGSTPSAVHADVAKSWKEAPVGMTETSANRINPDAIPQINFTNSAYNNNNISTRFLMSSSYLSIKNIALGYRLPSAILDRVNMRRASLMLTVENLATFTALKGYSPQQSFGGTSDNRFVPFRTYSLGVNIGL